MRVLIVDDHPGVRRGISALLQLSSADIEICGEAEDGRDAINKARTLKPDVIIMDVRMPILNGLEATREIRQCSSTIRVIMLSQDNSSQTREEARKAGAYDYVSKSCIWSKLLPALRNVLLNNEGLDRAF